MDDEIERKDFEERCHRLNLVMMPFRGIEPSDRVWSSVIIELLKSIASNQDDPAGSIEQVINCLRMK